MQRKRYSPPNDPKTIFIDRSLGGKFVPQALRAAAPSQITIKTHDEEFAEQNTPDEVWLRRAGERGWVILTKDDRIRYRPNEREALIKAQALVIILVAQGLKGSDMGSLFARALPQILDLASNVARPAIYKLTRDGKLRNA